MHSTDVAHIIAVDTELKTRRQEYLDALTWFNHPDTMSVRVRLGWLIQNTTMRVARLTELLLVLREQEATISS